ncbi:39S ribosomal protein L19, mitochondrial [Toxorhynchites rutilus septentrionalis]|uniref:39S ribosomal protein L19, mitochondrial n=1 Tax=Toxorhynchites rutilus septentrionalis TaxID=329112 RepID=UPI0024786067|nr:39S ribosomal protein L19, mitochondrial [Toxorhynchites rutilus septentrionalis]
MNVIQRQFASSKYPLLNIARRLDFLTSCAASFSTKTEPNTSAPVSTPPQSQQPRVTNVPTTERKSIIPQEYRFIYQEFLPDPKVEWRNPIREKLERMDMLDRRSNIDIPEFYVGSVLAVTSSDVHAVGKTSRFVGICIQRERCGLRARFILRNIVDHQGMEVMYDLYDPTLLKFEVLRLERRLDEHLLYLRDALDEYSTFDINMEPEVLPEGSPVPVNDVKVVLKPKPWYARWERENLQGVANVDQYTTEKNRRKAEKRATPWEKYDLMKEYRRTIPDEEQKEIFAEVYSQLHQLELSHKKMKRKRTFVKPTKLA